MMPAPWNTASIALMGSANSGSGKLSRMGIPTQGRGDRDSSSSFAHSMTCMEPRNRAIPATVNPPRRVVPRRIDDGCDGCLSGRGDDSPMMPYTSRRTQRFVLTYRPELDGLRGIAVLLVIGGHFLIPGMGGGAHVGVQVFFVLSGYLITSILRGHGSLVRFYVRRARRLLPALVLWLAVMLALGVVTTTDALPVLLYVANWAAVDGRLASDLGHTWSLATEEQFYLLWPLLLLVWRRPVPLLIGIVVAGATLRLAFPETPVLVVLSRFDALAWGCLLGLGVTPKMPRPVTAAAVGVLVLFTMNGDLGVMTQYGFTLTGVASFVVMATLVRRETGVLAQPALMATGRVSYGLYLWHFPIALAMQEAIFTFDGTYLIPTPGRWDDLAWTVGGIGLTFACAAASWFGVERWFLRQDRRPDAVAASAGSERGLVGGIREHPVV